MNSIQFTPPIYTLLITDAEMTEIHFVFSAWATKARGHLPPELRRRIDFCLAFVHRPEAVGVMVDVVADAYRHATRLLIAHETENDNGIL